MVRGLTAGPEAAQQRGLGQTVRSEYRSHVTGQMRRNSVTGKRTGGRTSEDRITKHGQEGSEAPVEGSTADEG